MVHVDISLVINELEAYKKALLFIKACCINPCVHWKFYAQLPV